MESSRSVSGSARRHMPRRSTRGPLTTGDDPLANPTPAPETASTNSTHSPDPASRASVEVGVIEQQPPPPVDLHFLQDRELYVQIPTADIHEAFLTSPLQPGPDVPLATLLQHGHFRRAADAALDQLLKSPPHDGQRIFELLYTRLACLILITRVDLASHEATPLIDFLAHGHDDIVDILSHMPWELRLLLVRLQSIASTDGGRRGMMSLYALAAEVRQHVKTAKETGKHDEAQIWAERLRDLGLRVADTLVEMGELETATRHLESLQHSDQGSIAYRKALLRIRLGDLAGAKTYTTEVVDTRQRDSLGALLHAANGEFPKAVEQWQQLQHDNEDAVSTSNLAVGLLYTGRIIEAEHLLESLIERLPAFPGALFNLGTVYELCAEQAVERKMEMMQNNARKTPAPDSGGWERANFEFKL